MLGFNGGLIGQDRTTSSLAAIGVWTLDEQIKARRNGIWPGAGDIDANNYIAAVESSTGDNQALEDATKAAIQAFVQGCKNDGIWDAIKASCILAGARTLAGALKPLKGTAPTNAGNLFVAGDYNRKTGLVGNGSTKYLDSNRNNNADPQDSKHLAVWLSEIGSTSGKAVMGATFAAGTSGFYLGTSTTTNTRINTNASDTLTATLLANNLLGASRSSSTVTRRFNASSNTLSSASQSPGSSNIFVFAESPGSFHATSRIAFYSIGESIDLALLDARVATLITAIGAAF